MRVAFLTRREVAARNFNVEETSFTLPSVYIPQQMSFLSTAVQVGLCNLKPAVPADPPTWRKRERERQEETDRAWDERESAVNRH